MRRLDQGIGEIAQRAFIFGELVVGWEDADAGGRFRADPAMHVVIEHIGTGTAEITTATAGCQDTQRRHR